MVCWRRQQELRYRDLEGSVILHIRSQVRFPACLPAAPSLPLLPLSCLASCFPLLQQSDWGATHSTVASALAGLDMEMPDADFFGATLAAAVANGSVPLSRVQDMVTRVFTAL